MRQKSYRPHLTINFPLEENMEGFQMFHTTRDCAACQPLLSPTAKIRHRAVLNLQCGWSCQAVFDISTIILKSPVRTDSLYVKATFVFFSRLTRPTGV